MLLIVNNLFAYFLHNVIFLDYGESCRHNTALCTLLFPQCYNQIAIEIGSSVTSQETEIVFTLYFHLSVQFVQKGFSF